VQRLLAAALASSVTACGLTMTTGPDPDRPPGQRPVCTESMDAPHRDAYPAALGLLTFLGGLLVYGLAGDDDGEALGLGLTAGGVIVAVASLASGGVGKRRVKRCQRAIADWEHGH
jgi:hypothetical protein